MTWVEPFFTCGECGGEVGRYPVTNLLNQQILDWRHRDAPPGTPEHRALLGTKAHHVSLARPEPIDGDSGRPEPAPPPEMPARPALRDDLPGPAISLDKLADEHGWTVQAWIMRGTLMDVRWKPNRVMTSVVLWLDRDGHRLVATWATKSWKGVPFRQDIEWDFDGAWSLGSRLAPLGGNDLRTAVKFPRMLCETCWQPPALHVSTPGGLVCYGEFHTPSQGGTPCSSDS